MAQPGCQRLGRGGNICEENTCFSQFSSRVLAPVQRQGEFAAIYEAFLQKGCSTSAATGGLGEVTGEAWQRRGGVLGKRRRAGKPRRSSLGSRLG